jgi:hypothetical protein
LGRLQLRSVCGRPPCRWSSLTDHRVHCISTGRLPQISRAGMDIQKPSFGDRSNAQIWRPYQDPNVCTNQNLRQPVCGMGFTRALSDLSEIVNDLAISTRAPQRDFTSQDLQNIWKACQNWRKSLPHHFRLEHTPLPHVLALHMCYHACILQCVQYPFR